MLMVEIKHDCVLSKAHAAQLVYEIWNASREGSMTAKVGSFPTNFCIVKTGTTQ